ncbi:unnamed protein product [Boreogadus saida]
MLEILRPGDVSRKLLVPQQRLIVGVISAMVEKELGERNFSLDSLKSRLKRYMEEKGTVDVYGTAVSSLQVHVITQTFHWSDLSVVCGLLRLDSSRCSAAGEVCIQPRGRNNGASEK